jgi:Fe2+ or Zn2+ uptake regulation protein
LTTFRFRESIGTVSIPKPAMDNLTPRQAQIVKILEQGEELPSRILLSKLSPAISERTLNYELQTLKVAGIVESKGQTNNRVWFFINHTKDS